jgi:hypothetical protein
VTQEEDLPWSSSLAEVTSPQGARRALRQQEKKGKQRKEERRKEAQRGDSTC